MTAKNDEEATVEVEAEAGVAAEPDNEAEATVAVDSNDEAENGAIAPPSAQTSSPLSAVARGAARHWIAIVLIVLLALSAGVTTWLYFDQYRPVQQTNAAAADEVITAASEGTVALLSYAPETLDQDFTDAKSHLTGDFLNYYNQFTEQVVSPAAKKNAVKTTATVVNSAVSELHPDSAVVLVFLNQTTTSTENPDGSFATSAVKVGLTKVDGTWRIGSFDPV